MWEELRGKDGYLRTDDFPKRRSCSDVWLRQSSCQTYRRRQAGWVDKQWGVGGGKRRVLGVIVQLHYSKQLKRPCAGLRGQRGVNKEESRTGICWIWRGQCGDMWNIYLKTQLVVLFFLIQHHHNQPLPHLLYGGRDLLLVRLLPSLPTSLS